MDAWAAGQAGKGPHHQVVSINWGRWHGIGMSAATGGMPRREQAIERSLDHPLIDHAVAGVPPRYICALSPRLHWVLGEHRVADRAVLPAMAYLELAVAAIWDQQPGRGIDLHDVAFRRPLVADGEDDVLEIVVTVNLADDAGSFRIVSQQAGWQEKVFMRPEGS